MEGWIVDILGSILTVLTFIIAYRISHSMGLFDEEDEDDIILENADLDCEPQNEFVSKKKVEKMDDYLDPGEKVHFMATDVGGGLNIDGEAEGMNLRTVATDQRILFRGEKVIGSKQTSIDYENISSVEVSFGMLQRVKRINLETNSKVFGIGVGEIGKDEVQDMAQFIREMAREASQSSDLSDSNKSATDEEGPLDKLERLGELRDNGVITENEFQEKKDSLLDQI